jgi:hypothetical protein
MKEIKAREGYYLTQVAEVGNDRLFITALKGANINETDWREATEDEKIAFEESQKEKLNTNGNSNSEMVEE